MTRSTVWLPRLADALSPWGGVGALSNDAASDLMCSAIQQRAMLSSFAMTALDRMSPSPVNMACSMSRTSAMASWTDGTFMLPVILWPAGEFKLFGEGQDDAACIFYLFMQRLCQ